MTIHKEVPRGQAMIELAVVVMIFSSLLAAILVVGVVGDHAIKASQGARFAAFDCDARPDYCRQSFRRAESKLRSALVFSDQREVLPDDHTLPRGWKTLGKSQRVIAGPDDVRLGIDLPRVDGADKNLLEKLAGIFRSLSLKAGPALFDLANPDHLIRSTVNITLWSPSRDGYFETVIPKIEASSRVALVSDAWAAVDTEDFSRRIRQGETPSTLVDGALKALYFPTKDLLMPLFELVGLESNTGSFRDQFHEVNHDLPYANSRVNGAAY